MSSRDDRHSSRYERRLSPASERRGASPPKKTPSPIPAEGEKKKKKKKEGSKTSPKDGKEKKKKKDKKKRKKESESEEDESGVSTKKKKKSKKVKNEKGSKKVSAEKTSNEIDEVAQRDEEIETNEADVVAAAAATEEEHFDADVTENIVEENSNHDEKADQPGLELNPVDVDKDPFDEDVAKVVVPEVEEERIEKDEFDESDDEHLTLHHDENDLVICFRFLLFSRAEKEITILLVNR